MLQNTFIKAAANLPVLVEISWVNAHIIVSEVRLKMKTKQQKRVFANFIKVLLLVVIFVSF